MKKLMMLVAAVAVGSAMAEASVSLGTPQQRYPWNGKMDIPYTLTDTDAAKTYQLVTSLTVGGVSKAVTNELGQVADGGYTNTVDCAELFGTAVSNQTAKVKLAVIFEKPEISIKPSERIAGPFLVIDLEPQNGNFLTKEYDYSPVGAWTEKGGWADEYKTRYLVLRKVEAGTYPAYDSMTTKTTSGYWIGVFEVTEGQYDRVMGVASPSDSLVAKSKISYSTIRGISDPSKPVAGTSFMANLCTKCIDASGNKVEGFDLPTEWQWNIAYNAGTTTKYYWGSSDSEINANAWYSGSTDWESGSLGVQKVGLKQPNKWGLYDIAGNVAEWCRDEYASTIYGKNDGEVTADDFYVGGVSNSRPLRGGAYNNTANSCSANFRSSNDAGNVGSNFGFRLSRMSPK